MYYDRIPLGRIKLIKTFNAPGQMQRTAHIACLAEGSKESPPLLAISYAGSNPMELFRRDYLMLAKSRHAMFTQFRGYNDSDLPMIIFQDELLPVQHVLQLNSDHTSALLCYLSFQAGAITSRIQGTSLSSLTTYSCDNVWIRPQTGVVCFGLEGPPPETRFDVLSFCAELRLREIPALSPDEYDSRHIIPFLAEQCSSQFVLSVLARSYVTGVIRPDEGVGPVLHDLHDVLSRTSGQSIARFPADECRWRTSYHYVPSDGGRVDQTEMANGTIRGYPYSHRYMSWLAQAPHIFDVLGIQRDTREDFVLSYGAVHLNPSPVFPSGRQDVGLPLPYYLFIRPPPFHPDGCPDTVTWTRSSGEELCFWSFDSTGQSPLSDGAKFGLPFFVPSAGDFEYIRWKADVYDLIRQWQELKGFDSSTVDFARSLGASIYEVLPGGREEGRFEEVAGDFDSSVLRNCHALTEWTSYRMDVDGSPTDERHERKHRSQDESNEFQLMDIDVVLGDGLHFDVESMEID
ncbi:hypothetical protein V5O48_015086 [Marasmius crinis-equi]|uniref:Uncharacterized protein n=1 Tax=Marasmius crinis-equi TaxID=585013 RepID=A0ABR3EVT0_9AGAR